LYVLDRFGFTPTEAKAYEELLRLGPSTGYSVARALGIARANTYQALEVLARRGAARKVAGRPATYVALPPVALVAELERTFRRELGALEVALRSLVRGGSSGAPSDLEILVSRADILDRAVANVSESRTSVAALVPGWAEGLLEPLDRAERRGVATVVGTIGAVDGGFATQRTVTWDRQRVPWPGDPLLVAVDRRVVIIGCAGEAGESGFAATMPVAIALVEQLLDRELGSS
jgi:HTH-type transcriptional regulator, sugar sensing transcriptional regulator